MHLVRGCVSQHDLVKGCGIEGCGIEEGCLPGGCAVGGGVYLGSVEGVCTLPPPPQRAASYWNAYLYWVISSSQYAN